MNRAYFDVPSDIVECATKLRTYFDERNIKDWALDGIGPLHEPPEVRVRGTMSPRELARRLQRGERWTLDETSSTMWL